LLFETQFVELGEKQEAILDAHVPHQPGILGFCDQRVHACIAYEGVELSDKPFFLFRQYTAFPQGR
jgi:hypothetical protein